VRNLLQKFDSTQGFFTGRVDEHPDLGRIDYVHIPLFVLREYFINEFSLIQNYWSFAIVRDPYSRFSSSVSQRLKKYSDKPIHMRKADEVRKEIDQCIEFLSARPKGNELLPPEYIHFQRQVDYVKLDGRPVVDNLYTVENIKDLVADLEDRIGMSLSVREGGDPPKANQSVVFRNDILREAFGFLHPVTSKVSRFLPGSVKNKVRSYVYVPRDDKLKELFLSKSVKEFVSDYYSEDLALYDMVRLNLLGKNL
jgi:hypothetical protein